MITQTATDVRTYGHLIDGQDVHTASTIARYSPETGQLVARFANGSAEDANAAVAAARRAFDTGPWPQLPAAERSKVLLAIAEVIRDNTEHLARIDAEEVGKRLPDDVVNVATGALSAIFDRLLACACVGDVGRTT